MLQATQTHHDRHFTSLAGARALIVGLGRFGGGVGVTQWLAGQGAVVTVTDQADATSLAESLDQIAGLPVTLCLGGHEACDLSQTDLVIINPAVNKRKSDLFREILRRKISWTTEMNLFCERCPAPVVGVTGSFGKSTTSAMLAHVLELGAKEGGREKVSSVFTLTPTPLPGRERGRIESMKYTGVHLGGNIGRSLLTELPSIMRSDVVVLEMSNAQLEDIDRIDWGPSVAVITNLFPHHLDRYENFDGYIQAKLNLARAGEKQCPVVVGELDPLARASLVEAVEGDLSRIRPVEKSDPSVELMVPGDHNRANADCVMTIARVMGLDEQRVRESLGSFRGLPHRLELAGKSGGVEFINDSKSTAPAATIIALDALGTKRGKLIAIVGGQKKDVPLEGCATALAQACREVICYGEAGPAFAAVVKEAKAKTPKRQNTEMNVLVAERLADAVNMAVAQARPGEIVLFSPGAPSFDQYTNFTERGKHFVALVEALKSNRTS